MVNLGRRKILASSYSEWEILSFPDYEQVADDGHNTISIGVCRGDGSIHLTFDHHCDRRVDPGEKASRRAKKC